MKQIESFKKQQDSRRNDIGNKMFEMFTNILLAKEGVKSYVERLDEIKAVVAKLKKDKGWYNHNGRNRKIKTYSGSRNADHTKDGSDDGLYTTISNYFKEHGKFPFLPRCRAWRRSL